MPNEPVNRVMKLANEDHRTTTKTIAKWIVLTHYPAKVNYSRRVMTNVKNNNKFTFYLFKLN